jgi:hypothetical protein
MDTDFSSPIFFPLSCIVFFSESRARPAPLDVPPLHPLLHAVGVVVMFLV